MNRAAHKEGARKLRVALLSSHAVLRTGLTKMIEDEVDLEVVAETDSPDETLTAVQTHTPNKFITDSGLPELQHARAAIQKIIQEQPLSKVMVLSDDISCKSVTSMLAAGATGYLSTTCSSSELFASIRLVANGNVCLDKEISSLIIENRFLPTDVDDGCIERLTERERQVLSMMAAGNSTKQIAFEWGVNCRTIGQHRQNIMEKLKMYSVAELTKLAIRAGISTLQY